VIRYGQTLPRASAPGLGSFAPSGAGLLKSEAAFHVQALAVALQMLKQASSRMLHRMDKPTPSPGWQSVKVRKDLNSAPHNLNHLLYKIRFFVFRFFLVASLTKIIYTKKTGRARVSARTVPDHKSPSLKGDLWLELILAAHQNPLFTIFSTVSTQLLPAFIAIWKHWSRLAFSIR
jgi:hypothetical protein